MNEQQLDQLEAQAVEILGALTHEVKGCKAEIKGYVKAVEEQLTEMLSKQRLANNEALKTSTEARAALNLLAQQAAAVANKQGEALLEQRQQWPQYIAQNARKAGKEQAEEFGEKIAVGLQKRLGELTASVEQATRRFNWMSVIPWAVGIGIGIVATIFVGVWALLPHIRGLSWQEVHAAATRLAACQDSQETHVCIEVDDKPQSFKDADGALLMVVKGM